MSKEEKHFLVESVLPIFHKKFWLDSVAKDRWDIVFVERGNDIIASMPFVWSDSVFGKKIEMPFLTQFLGPWFHSSKLSHQDKSKVLEELCIKLGAFASLNQRWSPQITNWLPFFWNGYQQSVRYTYRLNQIDDKDSIWKEMAENRRRNIKKAEKLFNVEKSDDPSFLYELVKGTFNRKDLQVGFIENNLINLYNACFENNASSIFYAQLGNEVIAGILVVYDAFSAYYLVGGVKDEYLKSGAMSLLLWTAITDSSSRVKCFDFEGSMNRGVESFFSSFASVQTPYYEVYKSNSVILTAIDSLRKVNSVIRK